MRLYKTLFVTLPFLFFTIAITIINQKNYHQWKTLAKNLITHDASNTDSYPLFNKLDDSIKLLMVKITDADKQKLEVLLQLNQNDVNYESKLKAKLEPTDNLTSFVQDLTVEVMQQKVPTAGALAAHSQDPSDLFKVKAALQKCDTTVTDCKAKSCKYHLDALKQDVDDFKTEYEVETDKTDQKLLGKYKNLRDKLVAQLAALDLNPDLDSDLKTKAQSLKDDLSNAAGNNPPEYPDNDAQKLYDLVVAMLPLFQ